MSVRLTEIFSSLLVSQPNVSNEMGCFAKSNSLVITMERRIVNRSYIVNTQSSIERQQYNIE